MADGSPTLYGKGRSAPDEVWGRVREDYLSGLPGIEVCRRHGVGLTAMRNRATREGWRRTADLCRLTSRMTKAAPIWERPLMIGPASEPS